MLIRWEFQTWQQYLDQILLVPPDRSTLQMVQDTPQINGIVSNLIQHYDTIFLNKEIPDVIAVVLYDYQAVESVEISLKVGQRVKVFLQGEDGWWQGESNGMIGRFPGSYVKVETKSRKEQFKEDMKNAKSKLDDEKNAVKMLSNSKAVLEKEISNLKEQNQKFQEEVNALKLYMNDLLKKEKLDTFIPKLDKYAGKIEQVVNMRNKEDEVRKNLADDVNAIKKFMKNPPADAKKGLKAKSQEKLESQMGMLQLKINSEGKKRAVANERLDDLYKDLTTLKQLLMS